MSLTLICPHCMAQNRVPSARLDDNPRCGACKRPLFTGQPTAVDEAGLARFTGLESLPILVDVWAAWCGPCRAMAPQFAAAARELEPRVRLLKLDADLAPQIMARHSISSIPSLLLFMGGTLRARQTGALSAGDIVTWTKTHQAE